ncbi:hypothetical protein QFZ28_005156 [Neobacillus niacini]|nr:hypothetical protein [Neobacillus niacini]
MSEVADQDFISRYERKYKEIDGKTEPYIYIGKGNSVKFEGDKPITVWMELENEVPASLYTEFTKKGLVFSCEKTIFLELTAQQREYLLVPTRVI